MFSVSLSAIALKWAPETLLQSLMVMLRGMLGIFIVIAIIWVFVAILNRATKKKA